MERNLISFALLPLSAVYFLVSSLVKILRKTEKISKPVICIGNLIAGGSGKTPAAIALGKVLREIAPDQKFQFAFLSRGYMGDGSKFVALHEGKHVAKNVGDEPMLLVKTAPTFVAKDRVFGAKQIENIDKIKLVVLDDGMQNNSLYKDLVILVVDAKIAFGNQFLIPAGPMRETLTSGLKKADLVIVIGEPNKDLLQKLSDKKIVRALLKPTNLESFRGDKLMAFCGLAYPQKFFSLLRDSDLLLCEEKSFPDHYSYKEQDLEILSSEAKQKDLKLITTKKDWVKFPKKYQEQIAYLDVELEFLDKDLLKKELGKIINYEF